ncbi:hypothetical protein ACIGXI_25895 [Kitasatospora aureofaciens]
MLQPPPVKLQKLETPVDFVALDSPGTVVARLTAIPAGPQRPG